MTPEFHDNQDLQLTAYALGDLSAEEAAAVEARLAHDAEARQYVADLRALADVLALREAEGLASGHTEASANTDIDADAKGPYRLTDAQRQAVLAGAGAADAAAAGDAAGRQAGADGRAHSPTATRSVTFWRRWGAVAAAAAVLAAVGLSWYLAHRLSTPTSRPPVAEKPEGPTPTPPPAPDDPGFERTPGMAPPIDVRVVAPPSTQYVRTPRQIPRAPGNDSGELVRLRTDLRVPPGTKNLAAGRTVTSSEIDPIAGDLSWITDGDKRALEGLVELGPGLQWVQIDLGRPGELHAVVVWHSRLGRRVYRDVIVQAGDDPDFVRPAATLFSNDADNSAGLGIGRDREYVESATPLVVDAHGLKARYVRLYSAGSTADDRNHYTEVEVFGREHPAAQPAKTVPLDIEAPKRN